MRKTLDDSILAIKSRRLELKCLGLDDLEGVYAYAKDPELARNTSWYAHENSKETRQFIEHVLDRHQTEIGAVHIVWAIRLQGSLKTIGTLSLVQDNDIEAHVDYALARKHWRRGYMTEALRAVIAWTFTQLPILEKINSGCLSRNIASVKVLEKVGFQIKSQYSSQRGAKFDHQIWRPQNLA